MKMKRYETTMTVKALSEIFYKKHDTESIFPKPWESQLSTACPLAPRLRCASRGHTAGWTCHVSTDCPLCTPIVSSAARGSCPGSRTPLAVAFLWPRGWLSSSQSLTLETCVCLRSPGSPRWPWRGSWGPTCSGAEGAPCASCQAARRELSPHWRWHLTKGVSASPCRWNSSFFLYN